MVSVGFIGLGNVGGKLAGSLLRNGVELTVRDLDPDVAQPFIDAGAAWGESPKAMAEACDIIITCLPSPAASAAVMEADDGSPSRSSSRVASDPSAAIRSKLNGNNDDTAQGRLMVMVDGPQSSQAQ